MLHFKKPVLPRLKATFPPAAVKVLFASYVPDVVIARTPEKSDGPSAVNVPELIVKIPSTSVVPETVHRLALSLKLPLETVKSPSISRFD